MASPMYMRSLMTLEQSMNSDVKPPRMMYTRWGLVMDKVVPRHGRELRTAGPLGWGLSDAGAARDPVTAGVRSRRRRIRPTC